MTDKPLSETHPTLFAAIESNNGIWHLEMTQRHTVDVAEHNRLMDKAINLFQEKQEELEKLQHLYYKRNEEIERLKKELEELETVSKYNALEAERLKKYLEVPRLSYWYDEGKKFGLVEGERRAMQRVKETILRLDKNFSQGAFPPTFRTLYRELGLGEEEKKHE